MEGAACTGIAMASLSRPCLVNTKRSSKSWHSEHMKVRRSNPGTPMVSSGTTSIQVISEPQDKQRIGLLIAASVDANVRHGS
jgi:hypothetical protein